MSATSDDGLDDESVYRWPIPPPEGWTAVSVSRSSGISWAQP